jgi:hypothetical protein
VAAKLIRLRYPAVCEGCRTALPAGTTAWWNSDDHVAACSSCHGGQRATSAQSSAPSDQITMLPPPVAAERRVGVAGGSAREEYEKRHQRRDERIEQRWGRLAGVVKFMSDDPQSTKAWAKGSEGERRLATHLVAALGDRAVLLHDRKVPGTRGNIDHLAIASSGVWVIDAKNYTGMVEHRAVGSLFRADMRIYVGGRDRTALAEGMGWQLDAVRKALDGAVVPVRAALCFIEAEWKLFAREFEHGGVWVTWAKRLATMIAAPGPLSPQDVARVADHLADALPPVPPKG